MKDHNKEAKIPLVCSVEEGGLNLLRGLLL
jgi:hypothetical protein